MTLSRAPSNSRCSGAGSCSESFFATSSVFADLSETTGDLSHLADAILNVTWRRVRRETSRQLGDSGALFSVVALGKLGGRELNYSSDIDLMFVHSGPGDAMFFRAAVNRLTEVLSSYSQDGMCYRVDLRLRPEGETG